MEKEIVQLRTQVAELDGKFNSLSPSGTFTSPNCSSSASIDSTLNAIKQSQKCAINTDPTDPGPSSSSSSPFADGPASRTRSSGKRPASSKQGNVLRKHLRSH